jgi:FKBP-type peptidyl-prolyl cis-trans isomerase
MKSVNAMMGFGMAAAMLWCGALRAEEAAKSTVQLPDDKAKISYAIGMILGRQIKDNGFEIDPQVFLGAVEDVMAGREPALTMQEGREVMTQAQLKKAEVAKAAGEKFLEENAKKDGVKVTASGLQYKVLREGSGASPAETDEVTVHYQGTLTDGTKFDSSYDRGEPATFALNQVIPGWTEGLQLMKPGAKYELYIPASLGYGEGGMPPRIPPNSVLVFQVELLSVGAEKPGEVVVQPGK